MKKYCVNSFYYSDILPILKFILQKKIERKKSVFQHQNCGFSEFNFEYFL